MDNEHLDKFTDEQLRQLHDLYTEIQTANEEFTNKDEKSWCHCIVIIEKSGYYLFRLKYWFDKEMFFLWEMSEK